MRDTKRDTSSEGSVIGCIEGIKESDLEVQVPFASLNSFTTVPSFKRLPYQNYLANSLVFHLRS